MRGGGSVGDHGMGFSAYDNLERAFEVFGRALVLFQRLLFRFEAGDLVELFQRHGLLLI